MFTHSCLFMKPRGVARNHVTGAESNTCPKDSHQLILKGPDLLQCVQRSVVGFLHLCIHAAPKPLLVLCKCFFHVCTHTHTAHWASGVSHTHTAHWASGVSHTHTHTAHWASGLTQHTHSALGQWSQSHTHSALGQWCQSHTQAHWASGVSHTHTQHTGPVVLVTHPVFWASGVSHTHTAHWASGVSHTHTHTAHWASGLTQHTHSALGQWSQSHTHSALGQWCQSHTHSTLGQWSQTHTVHWASGVSHTCLSLVFSSGAHCWYQSHTHTHACTQAHTQT